MESRRVIDLTELELAQLVRQVLREERPSVEPDRWLNSDEACEYLGMSKSELHKLTAQRLIPFMQLTKNGRLKFKRTDLDNWMAGNG